ncbi:MAG: hypothetical protein ACREIW_15765 [Chthoniobacterales bacterium]
MQRRAQSFWLLNLSILTGIALDGCSVAHDATSATYHAASATYHAASTTYHVVTMPVRIIKRNVVRRLPPGARVETTTATVVTRTAPTTPSTTASRLPGTAAPTRKHQMMKPDSSIATTRATPRKSAFLRTATVSSKPTASPAPAATPHVKFPIAQRVPGKSGLVMSPFDPEARYVDVSGYASGSKVKDPWTEKIFIVP